MAAESSAASAYRCPECGSEQPEPGTCGRCPGTVREADSAAQGCCRSGRHIFEPFTGTDDLGGGAQRCECGKLLIDRTLGGGRVVEINGPDFVGPSRSRVSRV